MQSRATTVEEYINSLPQDRAVAIKTVREIVLKNLPKGYVETMNWGMISYEIPLEVYPDTYNKKPLMYAALASQKNYMSLYLTGIYGNPKMEEWFKGEFKKAGKKLDIGKSCVRFTRIEDIPLDVIGETIAKVPLDDFVKYYEEKRRK